MILSSARSITLLGFEYAEVEGLITYQLKHVRFSGEVQRVKYAPTLVSVIRYVRDRPAPGIRAESQNRIFFPFLGVGVSADHESVDAN